MKSPRSLLFIPLFIFCFIVSAATPALAGENWKPVDPAELGLKAPAVEKEADAEAIFWEVYIDDSQPYELSLKNYVRIKVFNERGRDSQSKIELPYYGNYQIKDVAARVIKADGTIVELKKEDVFDRTVVKV